MRCEIYPDILLVSEGSPWTVIGTVAGIGVFMVIAVGLVVYWVRKKRKSGKETKE